MTVAVPPNTIVVYSDLLCPFAHVAVHRLWETRSRLGLDDIVIFDHHAFPLELLSFAAELRNGPATRIGSDSEVPVLGPLEPEAGWQLWSEPDWLYPNTVLLAFEAVHAARRQSPQASERLDRALRRAFWGASRSIGHHHVILDVAATVPGLDVDELAEALVTGSARADVFADHETSSTDVVALSPHLFLPDGSNVTNPGIAVHWQGSWARGFPVIDHDDPSVYEAMLIAAS
jgi:predicted DsbA family dithiol-disulfide isomerase